MAWPQDEFEAQESINTQAECEMTTKTIEEKVAEAIYRSPLHGMPFEDCCILAKEVCGELERLGYQRPRWES